MKRRQMKLKEKMKEESNIGNGLEKKMNILCKAISIVFLLISLVNIIAFIKVGMFPLKYLIPLIILIIVLNAISTRLAFMEKTRCRTKKIMMVVDTIFSVLFVFVFIYVLKTYNFLSGMNLDTSYKEQNYSVIVLKDSQYAKIVDLEDNIIGYFNNSMEGTDKAVKKLSKKVIAQMVGNEDLNTMANDLLQKGTDAILVEDSYKTILEEEVKDFTDKTKTIYTFKIKVDVEAISKDIEVATEPFNVYISGIDTYGAIASVSRSDVNMVITVNPNIHQILLINIPRDYYVQLHGTTGTKDKLTHAGIYGIEKSVQTVENLLDIDINYYVKVNFTSLEDIVNALGGITVYSKYRFTSYIDNYLFKEGYNQMNGSQALAFSRERKSFAEGDRMRGENQQAVIEGIIRKASTPSVVTKFNGILKSMEGKFQTNMSIEKMMELIKFQISKMPSWNVTSVGLTGSDSHQYTYSGGSQQLYVMVPSIASVNAAKAMIDQVFNGEELDSSYLEEIKNVSSPVQTKPVTYETYTPTTAVEKQEQETIKREEEKGQENTHVKVDPYVDDNIED